MLQLHIVIIIDITIILIPLFSFSAINQLGQTKVLKSLPIDPPMMQISVYINNSPVAGKSGDKLTASVIKQRLLDEAETDVALTVKIN